MSDEQKRTAVDVVAMAFAEAWGEHPNDTRTDAEIAVKALGLEQVGWQYRPSEFNIGGFCAVNAHDDLYANDERYVPVYRVAASGRVTEEQRRADGERADRLVPHRP